MNNNNNNKKDFNITQKQMDNALTMGQFSMIDIKYEIRTLRKNFVQKLCNPIDFWILKRLKKESILYDLWFKSYRRLTI